VVGGLERAALQDAVWNGGLSMRQIAAEHGVSATTVRVRAEVATCVLPCANRHAEVEGGLATIARDGPADNLG
jgi:hypothetical protein